MDPRTSEPNDDVSALLVEWDKERDRAVLDRLLPLIYAELHRQAHRYLRREWNQHSLQTTELINEAYVKLVGQKHITVKNREHFFAIAANLMREILVDRARKRNRAKRGGDQTDLPLREDVYLITTQRDADLIAIDEALARLSMMDPQQARVVELKFFGGLEIAEIAAVLGISAPTVKRDWSTAKLWLRRELSSQPRENADNGEG